MEMTTFVRKPFTVEAVQITAENIKELAPDIGVIKYQEDDGTPYIQVNRNKVPNIPRVFIDFWMTRMGNNVRCYSDKIFKEQFTPSTEEIDILVASIAAADPGPAEVFIPGQLDDECHD